MILKNKFKKIAFTFLITAIVFVASALVCFATAPNVDNIPNSPTENMQIFFYYDEYPSSEPFIILTYGYNVDGVKVKSCVFTQNFMDTFGLPQSYSEQYGKDIYNELKDVDLRTFYISGSGSTWTQGSNYNSKITNMISETDFLKSFNSQVGSVYEYGRTAFDTGYSQALKDEKAFQKGMFTVFNAPFVFIQNIVGFEAFGISVADVIVFIIIVCVGFVLIKFLGGILPL